MPALSTLLKGAKTAPPETRMADFRDRIAAHGVAAIDAVGPWLADPQLGAFGVRVITAVGRLGHRAEAAAALAGNIGLAGSDAIRRDIETAMVEFPSLVRRRAAPGRIGHEILAEGVELRGRPAIRYRIETHKQPGHFNVPRTIMDLLGISTDGTVDLDIRRSSTGGLVFSDRMSIASGTEIYPRADDPSTAELRALKPYESIDVTVAKDE